MQDAQRRAGEEPRLKFTKEEVDSLITWLENGQQGDEPMVGREIQHAIMYCNLYPDRMPQELVMLTLRIDEATRKARAKREPAAVGAT